MPSWFGRVGQQFADHGWLPGGTGGTLQRGMEWVMYTAAGLISGAPQPIASPTRSARPVADPP
jgi:hypothetical protein